MFVLIQIKQGGVVPVVKCFLNEVRHTLFFMRRVFTNFAKEAFKNGVPLKSIIEKHGLGRVCEFGRTC